MFFRLIFILSVFSQILLFSQTGDSTIINETNYPDDSFDVLMTDSLQNKIDSVYTDEGYNTEDSSAVIGADSIFSIIDSSVVKTEELQKYLYYQPFSPQSNFITKTDILRNDYRYTGDFFKVFPFSFERSYGFIGQPNDIYLFAERSTTTSYFFDGVPITNVLNYTIDFNHIQSEDIDSIEIVPLPRGFLHGFSTSPVSVNFISKDLNYSIPYSRIKYYQGPSGEVFFDGVFATQLLSDVYASLDVTNRKADETYKNSAFSIWQVKARLKYNLSNQFSLIGSYYFSKSTTGINGGVDMEEIEQTTQDVNSVLFSETLAPIYFENNSLDFKQHNFGLKIIAQPIENAYTNVDFYYKFNLNEYYNIDSTTKSKNADKDKVLGALLDQRFSFDPAHLSLQTGYQSLKHDREFSSSDSLDNNFAFGLSPSDYNSFFVSPMLSFTLFDSVFIPSIYYKYANVLLNNSSVGLETEQKFSGLGADLFIYLNKNFDIYVGYSQFDNELINDEKTNALEIKMRYKDDNGRLSVDVFNKKLYVSNLWGFGFHGSYLIWKILLEGRFSQYLVEEGSEVEYINMPETKFNGGIYYKDILFNSSLDLKTGFVANYTGKQSLKSLVIPHVGAISTDIESWLTIDFTLSGEIQKAAIVYFTWENLFDWKYYITPYYPMLQRNIRFGIAWEIFN